MRYGIVVTMQLWRTCGLHRRRLELGATVLYNMYYVVIFSLCTIELKKLYSTGFLLQGPWLHKQTPSPTRMNLVYQELH
jgi:hypothetical protein